jgi:acyl transferase domain-containing protein/NADP-dependent 3-hydroxy acid dehydrogenase YdfG
MEADGTATFLHVPSPGLLDRFLTDGARRFVFEGSECGGHIGPRASFPLWESQIERLLAFGESRAGGADFFQDLSVLFAGGIHDERSAAMVSALAAPLAERGAALGVLMGTAYLFTREAVATGAILPGFQTAAIDCESTVLLETSPGHVTRCADTPYVTTFNEVRERLRAQEVPAAEMWNDLEQLNLGRLRIASKGLRRDGDQLVEVPAEAQHESGMFMLGQVATARSETTSVAALHEQVTQGATDLLAARAAELGVAPGPVVESIRERPDPLDVAVVGMACVLPQADGLASYWANIVGGVDAVTEVPPDRWDTDRYFEASREGTNGHSGLRTPSKWGGFIPAVPFDALAYGIPPSSLASIEPVQLLALEVAARSLADAGYARRPFDRSRASVVFGAEGAGDLAGAYTFRSLFPAYFGDLPAELDQQLPVLTEDSFPGVLANVIAGRIANRLDLGGVNYTLDAACASSLAALDAACKELRAGGSDLVLCGGADLHNGIYDYLMFASAQALSATGRCATFDASADGIALGEGVVCVVLKRLADAERDGDRIYAVVKGVAGSSDGRSLGLTAPRAEGQRRALMRAYLRSGVSPAQVGLVEAHGTGTVVGDRTELEVLTEVFEEAGAATGACALGSVKSQIGHTKCAAGLAGFVKAAMAVHTGVRPPTGNLREPNPSWDPRRSPFAFDVTAAPWATNPGERYAAVSAFGFGGTNFHAVLAGYDGAPEAAHGLEEWPAELFCFRGADRAQATAAMEELARLLALNDAAGRPWSLGDLAAGVGARGAAGSPVQIALVADSLDDLAAKLIRAQEGGDPTADIFAAADAGTGDQHRVAFLFPGQGSQRPGMLADLFVAFPRLQRHLRGDAARYAAIMFPPAAFTQDQRAAQREAITDTRVAQPAMGIAGTAVAELLSWLGIRADMSAGHSYGELVALCYAGAIRQEDLLGLGEARATAILTAAGDDPGTMAAVKAGAHEVEQVLEAAAIDGVVIANHNAPDQVVISGPTPAIAEAVAALEADGLTARPIPVACAFHSPVVAAAADAFARTLRGTAIRTPAHPVWSNTIAAPYPDATEAIGEILAAQVSSPVRFAEDIESMYAAGARVFVEAGPGRVLTGLVEKILGDRPHVAVACDVPGEPGIRRLLLTVAELAVAGVPVDVAQLFRGRANNAVTTGDSPSRAGWRVNGYSVCTAGGELVAGSLRPARTLDGSPATILQRPTVAAAADRESAVLEFLRSSREAIAAQREVLLSYLGAAPVPPVELSEPPVLEPVVALLESPPAATPEPSRALGPDDVREAVRSIVAHRTGYPSDMLAGNLDLEADLSIDSIKRTEIIMELAERLRLASGQAVPEGIVEQLARLKTIDAIVAYVGDHAAGPEKTPQEPPEPAAAPAPVPVEPPRRYLVHVTESPAIAPDAHLDLSGLKFVVVDDGVGVGAATAAALRRRGADALLLGVHHDLESASAAVDGVIHLGALAPGGPPVLPEAFPSLRAAILGGARMLLVATGSGGLFGHGWDGSSATDPTPGLGLRGLVRTIAREYPSVLVRAVDVDPKDTPARIAEHLLAELDAAASPDRVPDHSPVIGYTNGTRSALTVVASELAAPSGSEATAAAVRELGLGPESVVVLTGGGRGITAACAIALARMCGCRIEILGRTPSPERPEHPDTAAAHDRPALRRALLGQGISTPAEVEAAMRRILSARSLHQTLESLASMASSVRYHSVDVCDADGVRQVMVEIHDRWERIDGVIHGAGVLEDRLLADKTPESFSRVFGTKVDGARALVAALEGRPPLRFFALFGSVSGVFGNPGQVDYAAANDALDTLARMWTANARHIAHRVVSVDWGPWASTNGGMVSPELEREYARRGIVMIPPEEGVTALFSELAWGDQEHCQVVYMGGSTAAFAGIPGA